MLSTPLRRILQLQRHLCSFSTIQKSYYFVYHQILKPHPEKAYKGGEDAAFSDKNLLAVCDGVGGWADHGVDPGLYSKELTRHISTLYKGSPESYSQIPKNLIIEAHKLTKAEGSTTCCILSLLKDKPLIKASYIGDSGYMIMRKNDQNKGVLVFKSQEQQRGFNFPYQIGSQGDPPQQSLEFEHPVQENDIVILGTDGLFDNVDEKQILHFVEPYLEEKEIDLKIIAQHLIRFTFDLSLDMGYKSPFARKSRGQYLGGKSDDITIIVAQVKCNQ